MSNIAYLKSLAPLLLDNSVSFSLQLILPSFPASTNAKAT